jgi:hypothetical protein
MRRTLGVGGATAVAIGATLALAGVASAHVHTVTAVCDQDTNSANYGKSVLTVTLTDYVDKPNSVLVIETAGTGKTAVITQLSANSDFTPKYVQTFVEDGTTAQSYEVKVVAHDSGFSFDETKATAVCPQPVVTTTTPSPTSTTTPSPTPAPTSAPVQTTTPAPAVAPAANKIPPAASPGLAYTGVSTTLPLIIGGVLIVLGAAALVAMRLMRRRRTES